jgi:putative flippase GtrA
LLFGTSFGRSLLILGNDAANDILAINVAKAAAVFLGLVWNFLFYRFVVFRAAPTEAAAPEDPEKVG